MESIIKPTLSTFFKASLTTKKLSKFYKVGSFCGALLLSSMPAQAYNRIVALSPDVADIIVALGATNKVVGKPAFNENTALRNVPVVGSHRNVSPEAVLAVRPDLVLGSYMVQPPSIYQRLNSLNVTAVNVAPNETVATFANSIRQVGGFVGQTSRANTMASNWTRGMATKPATQVRYILSYDGRIVAGRGTVGDELIKRAGGINAANVTGLRPLSREGWLAARPDVIIIADHNRGIVGSVAAFRQRPEIAASPAGRNSKIYFWKSNDFLRYGLNSPSVVNRLNQLARTR